MNRPAMTIAVDLGRKAITKKTKRYVVGTQKNRLNETVPLSTQNMLKLIGKEILTILRSSILFILTCGFIYH